MITSEFLTSEVPDPDAASRFLKQLAEQHPSGSAMLNKDPALLSDVLVLVSFSPLFAATLLQDPGYIPWLRRERLDTRVRDKQTLLESLARFALMHSTLPTNVLLARFRRRELMRVFLRDVRRLSTIAEVTDEVSNLADAVLEHALRISKQELDNRYGTAQEDDERGRLRPADLCIVSLGKLGSRELNYSSDIDLLFIFSKNGHTSGSGTHGTTSNLDYFSKLTQAIIKLVGGQGGEGAAYRVDMRLRPHGRVGPLALTLDDTVRYYRNEAAAWERQVLIRARASAGTEAIFRKFFRSVEDVVFFPDVSVETALANVALSKQKIDVRSTAEKGADIKLGPGGIREIEFIAQSLQLAHGGRDKWLRAPHTLVSLDRLAERGHLTSDELTDLFAAYDFLRYLEHILQIENGLQTHLVPPDIYKRGSIARRLGMELKEFDSKLRTHSENVSRVFSRVFGKNSVKASSGNLTVAVSELQSTALPVLSKLKERAPRFSEIIDAHLDDVPSVSELERPIPERDYFQLLRSAVASSDNFGGALGKLRRSWYQQLIEIVAFDAFGKLDLPECKRLQSRLAEASIDVALDIARNEVEKRYELVVGPQSLAILALGKLGSGSLDYDSDLDLVMVYEPGKLNFEPKSKTNEQEVLTRVIEVFTNVLSSITRDGSLYRVDLRLRPHGSDGPLVISRNGILEYFGKDAAIWELLAYVNLRAVGGDLELATSIEKRLRSVIHERARTIDPALLASETRAVRDKLERQKSSKRSGEIDFKYGAGGLLDVYFAVRYLQLRYRIEGSKDDRSTQSLLRQLTGQDLHDSFREGLKVLSDGYRFLSRMDHMARLSVGRTSRIRSIIRDSENYDTDTKQQMVSALITVRAAYEKILQFSAAENGELFVE